MARIFYRLVYQTLHQIGKQFWCFSDCFEMRNGKAPIESIMPKAVKVPLYRFINDPLGTVMGVESVKKNVRMADSTRQLSDGNGIPDFIRGQFAYLME